MSTTITLEAVCDMIRNLPGDKLERIAYLISLVAAEPRASTRGGNSTGKYTPIIPPQDDTESYMHAVGTDDLYQNLAWIKETPTYKAIYKRSLNQTAPNCCYFCGGKLSESTYQTMQNGFTFHQKCYDMLAERLSGLKDEAGARELFKEYPRLMSGFTLLHTYWPTYPPDWGSRARKIRKRAGNICEDCGSKDRILHVHHVRPISHGGKHTDDNLICLCSICHQAYHANWPLGRGSEKTGVKRKPYSQIKAELVRRAIDEEKDIIFDYTDQKDIKTYGRRATPNEIEIRNGYLMVHTYCHTRRKNRTFGVHKMTKLKILP